MRSFIAGITAWEDTHFALLACIFATAATALPVVKFVFFRAE